MTTTSENDIEDAPHSSMDRRRHHNQHHRDDNVGGDDGGEVTAAAAAEVETTTATLAKKNAVLPPPPLPLHGRRKGIASLGKPFGVDRILQCLYTSPSFRSFILSLEYPSPPPPSSFKVNISCHRGLVLIQELQTLFRAMEFPVTRKEALSIRCEALRVGFPLIREMILGVDGADVITEADDGENVDPTNFYAAFADFANADMSEHYPCGFFQELMAGIYYVVHQMSYMDDNGSFNASRIRRDFELTTCVGNVSSSLCTSCRTPKEVQNLFKLDISPEMVKISTTLEQAIGLQFKILNIPHSFHYTCRSCGHETHHSWFVHDELTKLLVVHLTRNEFANGRVRTLTNRIAFEETLDVTPTTICHHRYNLLGVVVKKFGHVYDRDEYVTFTRSRYRGKSSYLDGGG